MSRNKFSYSAVGIYSIDEWIMDKMIHMLYYNTIYGYRKIFFIICRAKDTIRIIYRKYRIALPILLQQSKY